MIILLSPTKIQNFDKNNHVKDFTLPDYMIKANKTANQIKQLSISELAELLNVNFKIAEQVHNHYFNWNKNHNLQNAKQAGWTFNGEAFKGLKIESFSESEIEYAQNHLRFFSGLYGILRPKDLIQPYRLDFGDNSTHVFPEDLYAYWKKDVNHFLLKNLKELKEEAIILNLASKEYFKIVDRKKINAKIIDIDFLEYQPATEKYKPIVIYIKKARGMMAKFVIKNKINRSNDLKAFSEEGYWYNEQLSSENKFVFTR